MSFNIIFGDNGATLSVPGHGHTIQFTGRYGTAEALKALAMLVETSTDELLIRGDADESEVKLHNSALWLLDGTKPLEGADAACVSDEVVRTLWSIRKVKEEGR